MTDLKQFFHKHADDTFFIPYVLTQQAISETDGGVAGMFEGDACGDYESGFGDAGGADVIEAVLEHIEQDVFLERIKLLNASHGELEAQVTVRSQTDETFTKADIPLVAEEVAGLFHDSLKKIFPEVSADAIDITLASTKAAVRKYLKLQYTYTEEHKGQFDDNSKPGM